MNGMNLGLLCRLMK